jgi:hypothetical protein
VRFTRSVDGRIGPQDLQASQTPARREISEDGQASGGEGAGAEEEEEDRRMAFIGSFLSPWAFAGLWARKIVGSTTMSEMAVDCRLKGCRRRPYDGI